MSERLFLQVSVIAVVASVGLLPASLGGEIPEIDSLFEVNEAVLVYVYQDWCHYCGEQAPVIDRLEEKYGSQVAFLRVDAGQEPDVAEALGVLGYPAVFVFWGVCGGGYEGVSFSGLTDEGVLAGYLEVLAGGGEVSGAVLGSCLGSLASGEGEDCEALHQSCKDRCEKISDKAKKIGLNCWDAFHCFPDPCAVFTPFGNFRGRPRNLDFCEAPGYIGCVTPLVESYHRCLEQCIEEYEGLNSNERIELRKHCRTDCSDQFLSSLYADCFKDACPEACVMEGYHAGNFTYRQDGYGSYHGGCDCMSYAIYAGVTGPSMIKMTEDGVLLGEPETFNVTGKRQLHGEEDSPQKVDTVRWNFSYVDSGDEWVQLPTITTDANPRDIGEDWLLTQLCPDEELMGTFASLLKRYGQGPEGEKSLYMKVTVHAYMDGDVLLSYSRYGRFPHRFAVQMGEAELEGRVEALEHPLKHLVVVAIGGNDGYRTTTNEDGKYAVPSDIFEETERFSLEFRLEYLRDGLTYFTVNFHEDPIPVTYNFTIQDKAIKAVQMRVGDGVVKEKTGLNLELLPTLNLSAVDLTFTSFYVHMTEVLEFYMDHLGEDMSTFAPVEVLTYQGRHCGAIYQPTGSYIAVGWLDGVGMLADYSSRARPKNREYHEFSHYAMHCLYGRFPEAPPVPIPEKNHDGYVNPSTADSYVEGFAEFMSLVIGDHYDNWWGDDCPSQLFNRNIEDNYKTWGWAGKEEEYAVAGVLWDLYDSEDHYEKLYEIYYRDYMKREVWPYILEKADADGDGVLNEMEFIAGMFLSIGDSDSVLEPEDLEGLLRVVVKGLMQLWDGLAGDGQICREELRDAMVAGSALEEYDLDGDSMLSCEELDCYGPAAADLIEMFDLDGNDKLEQLEIHRMEDVFPLENELIEFSEDLESFFSFWDEDKNGYFDKEELIKLSFNFLIREFDSDGNNELNFEEVIAMLEGDTPKVIEALVYTDYNEEVFPITLEWWLQKIEGAIKVDDEGVSLEFSQIWQVLRRYHEDFTSVYEDLKVQFPEIEKEIDEIFLSHGFFFDKTPGDGEYSPGEPFRDTDEDGKRDEGEYYVDLAIGGPKHDPGEEIGRAADYGRSGRRSTLTLPGQQIRTDSGIPSFLVEVEYHDNPLLGYVFPTGYYRFEVPCRNGTLVLGIPPADHDATLRIKPIGVETTNPLVFNSKRFQDACSESMAQGFFVEHDFGVVGQAPEPVPDPWFISEEFALGAIVLFIVGLSRKIRLTTQWCKLGGI